MRRFLVVFLVISLLVSGYVCASAATAAARVSVGVAGVIEKQLVRRGFAANDPLFQATLDAVGVAANDAVFNAAGTVGMAAAGVAGFPAWATVAVGLGIGALTFGAYKLLTDPVTVTDPVTGVVSKKFVIGTSTQSVADLKAAALAVAPPPASSTTSFQYPAATVVFPKVQAMTMPMCSYYSQCASLPSSANYPYLGNSDGYGAIPFTTIGDFVTYVNYNISQSLSGAVADPGNPNVPAAIGHVVWITAPSVSSADPHPFGSYGGMYAQANLVMDWAWSGNYDSAGYKTYIARTDGYFSTYWAQANPNQAYVKPPESGSFDHLMATLTAAQASAPLSNGSLADVADAVYQKAAADPANAGKIFPYSLTDPVTASDVSTWSTLNPTSVPTMTDAMSPIGSTVTIPNPYAPAAPAVSTSTPPVLDLGPDPAIPAPGLESTPTASQILSPILGLMPDLKSFVVPSHTATCPRPTASVWGKTLTLSGHCDLLDAPAVRDTLYAVMALVWTMVGLFIVLKA
ncbi:hypothetical protein [Methylobacter tundripaludum]|nr:hypothetical protein [Methylobacter tundripaludum]